MIRVREELGPLFTDPGGPHTISGTLDKTLSEIFMPDYGRRLEQARQRLLDDNGDQDGVGSAAE
ncbi:hypothetical protein ACFV2X_29695 [Streptomyces sp. NPDC059679]|uniref:hypothetical protein n=1 Tax=Streptomyces sp. NPDC059679 TaxID=3346903 RepID=UPI0036BB42FF